MTLTVVLGPKTRLGQAVIAELAGRPVLAVARDAADVTALGLAPDAVIDVTSGSLTDRVSTLSDGPVRLVIAALGPVHPVEPDFDADLAAVQRDLAYVDEVIASGRAVQIVFVSSVIALAPGDDRRYYGGWKNLLEHLLEQRIAAAGHDNSTRSSLAVLYPGRLRSGRAGKPWHLLHASYGTLSRAVLDGDLDMNSRRTLGVDSRIWLAVRSVSFVFRSLTLSTRRHRTAPGGATARRATGNIARESRE